MKKKKQDFEDLSPRLKRLVDLAVTNLGFVLREELGEASFQRIEKIRREMTIVREANFAEKRKTLRHRLAQLEKLNFKQKNEIGRAFTLMLEMMNSCENAYRSSEIRKKEIELPKGRPESVIYVLTAHPTEARAPENIRIFHELQLVFTRVLAREEVYFSASERMEALHWTRLAWKIPIVRSRKPQVRDEAEFIYSSLSKREALIPLIKANIDLAPVYIRSWVGGDKDGHPRVNEKTFLNSLEQSRRILLEFTISSLKEIASTLPASEKMSRLHRILKELQASIRKLRRIRAGDGRRVAKVRALFKLFLAGYELDIGSLHPSLIFLSRLMHIFPALVVPLEFRESSTVLRNEGSETSENISRMLRALAMVSKGADPRWYVQGLIVSMTDCLADLQLAGRLVRRHLGAIRIPVIPLFEQAHALKKAHGIVEEMIQDPQLSRALRKNWRNRMEVMLGYSDSAKEKGVLLSRIEVAEAMFAIEKTCRRHRVVPLFFQGSGGSVDRGGGSVVEQTMWWPSSALRNYKVTVQGEMVERSLASGEITLRQLERIIASAGQWRQQRQRHFRHERVVKSFAERAADFYERKIHSQIFLSITERSTLYPFLDALKIGSRPAKRSVRLTVESLRAIPWIMCWTQTRVLFPTWWGVGSAWRAASIEEKKALRKAYGSNPIFSVYVRALGFTLAKVDLAVWSLYLERGVMESAEGVLEEFLREHEAAIDFYQHVRGTKEFLPEKTWLRSSISLRSPMIHPLNLLQIIALASKDMDLLRMTVTGISSGMLTTG